MKAVSAHQGPQPTLLAAAQMLLELKEAGRARLSVSASRGLWCICPACVQPTRATCVMLWAATHPTSAPELAGGLKYEGALSVPELA